MADTSDEKANVAAEGSPKAEAAGCGSGGAAAAAETGAESWTSQRGAGTDELGFPLTPLSVRQRRRFELRASVSTVHWHDFVGVHGTAPIAGPATGSPAARADGTSHAKLPSQVPRRLIELVKTHGVAHPYRKYLWAQWSGAEELQSRASTSYSDLVACLSAGDLDQEVASQIDLDLPRTFPGHEAFAKSKNGGDDAAAIGTEDPDGAVATESAGTKALRRVLGAYALHRPDIGYLQSMNFVAAFLLLVLEDEATAFWALHGVCTRVLPGYYTRDGGMEALKGDMDVFQHQMRKKLPHVVAHFARIGLDPMMVLPKWLLCAFTTALPPEAAARVWDSMLLASAREHATAKVAAAGGPTVPRRGGGQSLLVQVALAIVAIEAPALLEATDFVGAATVLQGIETRVTDVNDILAIADDRSSGFGALARTPISRMRAKASAAGHAHGVMAHQARPRPRSTADAARLLAQRRLSGVAGPSSALVHSPPPRSPSMMSTPSTSRFSARSSRATATTCSTVGSAGTAATGDSRATSPGSIRRREMRRPYDFGLDTGDVTLPSPSAGGSGGRSGQKAKRSLFETEATTNSASEAPSGGLFASPASDALREADKSAFGEGAVADVPAEAEPLFASLPETSPSPAAQRQRQMMGFARIAQSALGNERAPRTPRASKNAATRELFGSLVSPEHRASAAMTPEIAVPDALPGSSLTPRTAVGESHPLDEPEEVGSGPSKPSGGEPCDPAPPQGAAAVGSDETATPSPERRRRRRAQALGVRVAQVPVTPPPVPTTAPTLQGSDMGGSTPSGLFSPIAAVRRIVGRSRTDSDGSTRSVGAGAAATRPQHASEKRGSKENNSEAGNGEVELSMLSPPKFKPTDRKSGSHKHRKHGASARLAVLKSPLGIGGAALHGTSTRPRRRTGRLVF